MPTVYVTQIPIRKDKQTGDYVPSLNISPASEFGAIEILMPSQVGYIHIPTLFTTLREKLSSYNAENGDVLLPLGDPGIIAASTAILAIEYGNFSILKWERNLGRYVSTHFDYNLYMENKSWASKYE
jgi:hypothetical protein